MFVFFLRTKIKPVPSPDDCPFREQKIVLTNSLTKNRDGTLRTKRDGYCQTELTLPPILPKEIEDALKPFFTYTQEQQQTPVKDCDNILNTTNNMSMIDHDARDASLRRKLFQTYANVSEASSTEYERDILLDSPTPQTPELVSYHLFSFLEKEYIFLFLNHFHRILKIFDRNVSLRQSFATTEQMKINHL